MALWLHRFRDCLLGRQSVTIYPLVQQAGANASIIRPLLERSPLAEGLDPARAPVVARLLLRGRPSTILWAVGAVVVLTVNRVLGRWPGANVGSKGLEACGPSITDANSACAIKFVIVPRWISAAAHHINPGLVKRVLRVAVFGRVLSAIRTTLIIAVASARECIPPTEVAGDGNDLRTAVAPTQPTNATAFVDFLRQLPDHHQSTEPLANQIKRIWSELHAAMMQLGKPAVKEYQYGEV